MKARIPKDLSNLSQKQIKAVVADEYRKCEIEHAQQFSAQLIACFLYTMHLNGYTLKACKKIYDSYNATFKLMEIGICGADFNPLDCIDWVKNKLKIDLTAEISAEMRNI